MCFEKGEEVSLKVIEFNKDSKREVLSHTQTFKDIEDSNLKSIKNQNKLNNDNLKNTLGDNNEKLKELKDIMDSK